MTSGDLAFRAVVLVLVGSQVALAGYLAWKMRSLGWLRAMGVACVIRRFLPFYLLLGLLMLDPTPSTWMLWVCPLVGLPFALFAPVWARRSGRMERWLGALEPEPLVTA